MRTAAGQKRERQAAQLSPEDARAARITTADRSLLRRRAFRIALVFTVTALAFLGVGAQLVLLGLQYKDRPRIAVSVPLSNTFVRPDIVDRNGNLLATDVAMQSLHADPSQLLSADETLRKLETVLPGITTPRLRRALADRKRKFVWIKRGISPATAQRIHDLGLPGLKYQAEPKRSYPQGRIAGHIIGHVNIDNKGTAGIERHIDTNVGIERLIGMPRGSDRQVRLTIDMPAQIALEQELAEAMRSYGAGAASGIVLDAHSGAVRAAASVPTADPADPVAAQHLRYIDRLKRGTYELGSIFKAVTIAMALEKRTITLRSRFNVSNPIEVSRRFSIADKHASATPLTVEEIFVRSSNVGAGRIALEVGQRSQEAFLKELGLLEPMQTEAGPTAKPQVPESWQKAEVVTIAYGHGLAVAPLQFAAAGATLINGGFVLQPTFIEPAEDAKSPKRILSERTSRAIRDLMRLNVTSENGSGRAARVPGYGVGGKTGTADLAADGEYDGKAVVTSFFAAFPMSKPRYVVLVTLHDPKPASPGAKRYASLNAAPTTGRIIRRVAPLLGVLPRN